MLVTTVCCPEDSQLFNRCDVPPFSMFHAICTTQERFYSKISVKNAMQNYIGNFHTGENGENLSESDINKCL